MRRQARLLIVVLGSCVAAIAATVSFSTTIYNTSSFGPGQVVSADMNRDGLPDMVVADTQTTPLGVSVFLATSPGHFGAEKLYPISTATNPDSPLAADLNGDGFLDLILRDWHVAVLHILWNNGDGTLRAGPDVPLSDPATSFDLGDFNHDGIANGLGRIVDRLAQVGRKLPRRLDRLDLDFRIVAMRSLDDQEDGVLLALFL